MIIKKPYAFMIRHFKAIHLLITIFTLFIAFKTNAIFKFFNDYAKSGYYTYSNNLTGEYINFYLFLSIIVVLLLSTFIYLLMRWKKKNGRLYITTIIYYLVVFFLMLFYFNVLGNLLNTNLDIRVVRAYRDIAAIIYFPQYIFVVFALIRALGFNIKQFDFKKDLEELDIAEEDEEEVELTFGENTYKVKRWFRKHFREFTYYIKENKYFFWTFIGAGGLVLVLVLYLNIFVYGKKYKESELFNIDGVVFSVEESYITDVDLSGNIINKDKNYLIVKLNMENTNRIKTSIETDALRLKIGNENYYPIYSKDEYFKDLGKGYYKNTLYSGEKYTYLVIYEIPKKEKYNNAVFRMVNNISVKNGEIDAKYKDVNLKVNEYFKNSDLKEYNIKEAIGLDETTLTNSEFLVNDFEIGETFTENFQYCVNECFMGKKIIKPDLYTKGENIILKINLESSIDDNLFVNKYVKNSSDFLKYFANLNYTIDGKVMNSKFNVINLEGIETNNVYIEVDKNIVKSKDIDLIINIRNQKYLINLSK